MGRSGHLGVIYIGSATAVPVGETHDDFDLGLETDMQEDTAHGDAFRTRVPGLRDFTLGFQKWNVATEVDLLDYAEDRTVVKFYLYPDRTDNTVHWSGTGYVMLDGFTIPLEGIVNETYTLVPASQPILTHA
jgi:hypothetical protein